MHERPPPTATRRERGARRRPRGARAVLLFLGLGALPLAAIGWFLLQPPEWRADVLSRIPEGAGGRATKAGILLGALVVLAWVVLPAFHGASASLNAMRARLAEGGPVRRVLLFPVEAVVGLLWLVVQVAFALDVVLVIAAGLGLVLAAARIAKPDLLEGFVPWLT